MLVGASSIILAHNHPSGSTAPSSEDYAVTEKLKKAAEYVGVALLDHVIVTDDPNLYYSFMEK